MSEPGSGTPADERPNAAEDATWSCKIGPASRGDLPSGSDAPMRAAVEAAFRKLTGHDPEWTFSGWAHDLTEAERAVVEDRLPRPRVIAAAAREQMERAEAVIGTDLDPDPAPSTPAPEASGRPKWEPLTLREAAIEAILIREQDTAFSTVACIIAALPAPSSSPVGDRAAHLLDLLERMRDWCLDGEEQPAPDGTWTLLEAVNVALAAADRGEPTDA